MNNVEYRLTLESWNKNSAVRTKPNIYSLCSNQTFSTHPGDWYPKTMLPYFERLTKCDISESKVERLLAQHLVYFLNYTTILEHLMVIRSLEIIIHGKINLKFSEPLKAAGMHIYTDEGYHALFSHQLSCQVSKQYSIGLTSHPPYRIQKLNEFISTSPPQLANTIYFCIGFVSETIIAKEISQITSLSLKPQVYALLKDHLEDEIMHAHYFSEVFQSAWAQANIQQKDIIASILPRILKTFCLTDVRWLEETFKDAEVPETEITNIVENINSESNINRKVAKAAKMTFSVLRKVGFFNTDQYAEQFRSEGLPYA